MDSVTPEAVGELQWLLRFKGKIPLSECAVIPAQKLLGSYGRGASRGDRCSLFTPTKRHQACVIPARHCLGRREESYASREECLRAGGLTVGCRGKSRTAVTRNNSITSKCATGDRSPAGSHPRVDRLKAKALLDHTVIGCSGSPLAKDEVQSRVMVRQKGRSSWVQRCRWSCTTQRHHRGLG